MLGRKGIKVLKFSAFDCRNLEKLKDISLSFKSDGFCYVRESENGKIRLIAYDDRLEETLQKTVLLHEYAHIHLKHTQQCQLGELEATCFASIVFALMSIEDRGSLLGLYMKRALSNVLTWKGMKSA